MNPRRIEEILEKVRRNEMTVGEALETLRDLPFQDLGFARIDHHRPLRTGIPEIILGDCKEFDQIAAILRAMTAKGGGVLVSRLSREKADRLLGEFPVAEYFPEARLLVLREGAKPSPGAGVLPGGGPGPLKVPGLHPPSPLAPGEGFAPSRNTSLQRGVIGVLAAGTSDLPVAEEARVTAQVLGNEVFKAYDVGIAGLPRLLAEVPRIRGASVLIVVAGMEGALPSVVAGLVGRPVIAVPTSVGYGASFGGITALLAMLNSCVPGVTVVNIDNGIGAAVAAHLINTKDDG